MLRLSPSHRPLWRTETSLQLGADGGVRIDDVAPWQERLLDALRTGMPDAMLVPLARSLGAPEPDAQRFAERIVGALVPGPTPSRAVRAELPSDITFAEADALAHGWRAGGLDATTTRWREDHSDRSRPVLIVADHLHDPRRVATLMASDITHLPIALAGDRVIVGPLVVPGRTACLACLHAHRTDVDPQWPLLAAQLIGGARTATDMGLVLEAAVLAARMLQGTAGTVDVGGTADRGGGVPDTAPLGAPTLSVTLSLAHARRVWHAHRPHAGCPCRSPAGIGRVVEDATRHPAPTTTATGFARPA